MGICGAICFVILFAVAMPGVIPVFLPAAAEDWRFPREAQTGTTSESLMPGA